MYDLLFKLKSAFPMLFQIVNEETDPFAKFSEVIKPLLGYLWIASALVSTFWLVFRIIKTTHRGGEADDQADYEKAKKARKRAMIAWIFGLCWPVILFLVWPLIPLIGGALGNEQIKKYWPDLW